MMSDMPTPCAKSGHKAAFKLKVGRSRASVRGEHVHLIVFGSCSQIGVYQRQIWGSAHAGYETDRFATERAIPLYPAVRWAIDGSIKDVMYHVIHVLWSAYKKQ